MPAEAGRIARAHDLYMRAVFQGETGGLAAAGGILDAVEADLSLERGRVLHAAFLADRSAGGDPRELDFFERAAVLYRGLGDERGEGEARFWIGT
ncbi:MAG TPA: tetratricopeptide repeat protein, partial [Phytomonospora sp.]